MGRLWGAGTVPELTEDELKALPDGWRWTKVSDLGRDPEEAVQVGPMSMRSRDFVDMGTPVLNVGCIQWGYIDDGKANYLPEPIAAGFARYMIRKGDLLFTRSGTVGRCAVAQERHDGWLMTFHLLRVRTLPSRCLPEFLRIVLEGSPHIRRQTRQASIGTTRAGFNTNLLAGLDIPLPPIDVQAAVVAEVDRRLSVSQEAAALVQAASRRSVALREAVLSLALSARLPGILVGTP